MIPRTDMAALLPILLPCAGGVWILVQVALMQRRTLRAGAALALLFLGVSAAATVMLLGRGAPGEVLSGALLIDGRALVFHLIFVAVAMLTVLVSVAHLESQDAGHGEFYALLLFAVAGMTTMAASENLLTLFLGLEVLSIPLYALAGFTRDRVYSIEAALKYFLLGAFSTGFVLYGIAFLYGATGRIDLTGIASAVSANSGAGDPLLLAGAGLLLVGLAFKVAAVPFHFWAPDVYQGALAPVAGFMATGTKAAAFAMLLRIVTVGLDAAPIRARWVPVVSALAILSMVLGNLIALAQQNIKRMLAYSSIANAGYLLVALAAVGTNGSGAESIYFYLAIYGFMTVGAFAVAAIIGRADEGDQGFALSAYAGLGRRRPFLAAAMALFMLSLTGIPPAAGFMAKFYIFRDAVHAGLIPLAAIGLLASVIGAFYYLRVIVQMYFREPAPEAGMAPLTLTAADAVALTLAAVAILYFGVIPSGLLNLARLAG
ncbi:MAG TPA: NADH-quinone oxidoreductase subunit N [Candidatus Polarisedimenticolia bacterium]|nr:NADH-quinone oxidoreductase subunit N [Candidatus Polarisedimenticolia bacterium]